MRSGRRRSNFSVVFDIAPTAVWVDMQEALRRRRTRGKRSRVVATG